MKCPKCKSDDSRCWESKMTDDYRSRVYKCNSCGIKFRTKEIATEIKDEGCCRYIMLDEALVDPKTMLESIKRPFAELHGVLRTYDDMLK